MVGRSVVGLTAVLFAAALLNGCHSTTPPGPSASPAPTVNLGRADANSSTEGDTVMFAADDACKRLGHGRSAVLAHRISRTTDQGVWEIKCEDGTRIHGVIHYL